VLFDEVPIQEELREPSATWRDGQILARQYPAITRKDGVQYGVDCDCYSIFIGSILKELNIQFNIKMTSYFDTLGFDNGFQHVYIIVPYDNGNYITVDPVVHAFNYEKPEARYELFTLSKKIHSKMSEVYILNGFEEDDEDVIEQIYENSLIDLVTGRNIEGVLGSDDDDIDLLQYLKTTKIAIQTNPEAIRKTHDPDTFVRMLDLAIDNWHDETKREIVLEQLSNIEEHLISKNQIKLSGLDLDDDLSGDLLGGMFSKVKQKNKENKAKRVAKRTAKSSKGTSKIVGKAKARFKDKTQKLRENLTLKNKKGTVLNRLNKLNPATLAVRNAFRTCISFNFLGLATILAGKEAKDKGVTTKVEDLYFKLGGKNDKLTQTIQKAKSKKPIFNKDATDKVTVQNDDLNGLGEIVTIASVTAAAAAPLATVVGWLKSAGLMASGTASKAISNIKANKATKKVAKATKKATRKAKKATKKANKTGLLSKLKDKKADKKAAQQAIVESGEFDEKDLNHDGKVSILEKIKSKKNDLDFSEETDSTTTTDIDIVGEKTANEIEEFANSSNEDSNDEKSIKNIAGKFVKEHPIAVAVGATVVVSGIALSIPQVRSWLGIGQKDKLGLIPLS